MPSAFIPPWLTTSYDPIGAFQRSLQIGAQIGEAQTRIAEQQRQANMEHAAKQQAMQANILKAQQEMEMEKAYRQQQLSLENARLEETKQRNLQAGLQAAASLKEREAWHQGELARQGEVTQSKRADQEKFAQVVQENLAKGMSQQEAVQAAQLQVPTIGVSPSTIPTLAGGSKGAEAAERFLNEHKYSAAVRKVATIDAQLSSAGAVDPKVKGALDKAKAEAQKEVDAAEEQLRGKRSRPAGQSPYPEGTILKKKDGSRWVVRNGIPVPYSAPVSSATAHDEEPADEEGE